MKRIFTIFLLLLLLTGCAGAAPEAAGPTAPTTANLPTSFTGLGGNHRQHSRWTGLEIVGGAEGEKAGGAEFLV